MSDNNPPDNFKETLEKVCDNILASGDKKYQDLLASAVGQDILAGVDTSSPSDVFLALAVPVENLLKAVGRTQYGDSEKVAFVFQRYGYLSNHFTFWLRKVEGHTCSADKSCFVMRQLLNHLATGQPINFSEDKRDKYYIPQKIFTDEDEIIGFFEGIRDLYYGNPTTYLDWLDRYATNARKEGG